MSWRYYSYKPSKPIKVEGGIKAKSKRGDIGETWWSKRWVNILESFGWNNRLERGRRYARAGQVIEFKLNSGIVNAKVQGTVRKPYNVTIQIENLNVKEWEKIIDLMAEKAIFAAKLLAGEMPQNIEELFESVGIPLFPKSKKDIKTNCSCPDYANPCKHIAAVHYILAEEFDRDPFMLFEIRGQTKQNIITLLRNKRSKYGNNSQDNSKKKILVQKRKNFISPENYWKGDNLVPFTLDITIPKISASIIKRMEPPDFWNNKEEFVNQMSRFYDKISKKAIEIAYDEYKESSNYRSIRDISDIQSESHEEKLHDLFEKETGKNAIWRGKETKGYLQWKRNKNKK